MKKLLVAGIAAAALYSAPALAGPPSGVFNWSGFYIGANGGELWNQTNGFYVTSPGFLYHSARNGVGTAGLHGGVQGQWGNIVAGIEGGFNAALSNTFGSTPGGGAGAPCGQTAVRLCQGRINDLLTVGGRLGFAWDRFLVYGSGGYANGAIEINTTNPGGSNFDNDTQHQSGWYGGAGIEYAVWNNLTIGIDWKHFDLRKTLHQPTGGSANIIDVSAKGDAVTARLTLKGG
jgi:outer membrane immunogenic protein